MALLAGGASYSMGDCLLTVLLGRFTQKGHCFGLVAAYFGIESDYVRDNLAKTKIDTLIRSLNYLND